MLLVLSIYSLGRKTIDLGIGLGGNKIGDAGASGSGRNSPALYYNFQELE